MEILFKTIQYIPWRTDFTPFYGMAHGHTIYASRPNTNSDLRMRPLPFAVQSVQRIEIGLG
jgi:hypothetical protein